MDNMCEVKKEEMFVNTANDIIRTFRTGDSITHVIIPERYSRCIEWLLTTKNKNPANTTFPFHGFTSWLINVVITRNPNQRCYQIRAGRATPAREFSIILGNLLTKIVRKFQEMNVTCKSYIVPLPSSTPQDTVTYGTLSFVTSCETFMDDNDEYTKTYEYYIANSIYQNYRDKYRSSVMFFGFDQKQIRAVSTYLFKMILLGEHRLASVYERVSLNKPNFDLCDKILRPTRKNNPTIMIIDDILETYIDAISNKQDGVFRHSESKVALNQVFDKIDSTYGTITLVSCSCTEAELEEFMATKERELNYDYRSFYRVGRINCHVGKKEPGIYFKVKDEDMEGNDEIYEETQSIFHQEYVDAQEKKGNKDKDNKKTFIAKPLEQSRPVKIQKASKSSQKSPQKSPKNFLKAISEGLSPSRKSLRTNHSKSSSSISSVSSVSTVELTDSVQKDLSMTAVKEGKGRKFLKARRNKKKHEKSEKRVKSEKSDKSDKSDKITEKTPLNKFADFRNSSKKDIESKVNDDDYDDCGAVKGYVDRGNPEDRAEYENGFYSGYQNGKYDRTVGGMFNDNYHMHSDEKDYDETDPFDQGYRNGYYSGYRIVTNSNNQVANQPITTSRTPLIGIPDYGFTIM